MKTKEIVAKKENCILYRKGFCVLSRQKRKCEFDLNDGTCRGYTESKIKEAEK